MAQNQKRQWLARVLDEFEGPLLRYACSITGDIESARDVVQDTFLKLWNSDPKKVEHHLAPWLFTVCRNRAIDLQRKEKRMVVTDKISEMTGGPIQESRLVNQSDQSVMLKQLAKLPANQQEVIRLKFQNGLSYKDIAKVTGLSVSNVGFLIHSGVKRLRVAMAKQMEGGAV